MIGVVVNVAQTHVCMYSSLDGFVMKVILLRSLQDSM